MPVFNVEEKGTNNMKNDLQFKEDQKIIRNYLKEVKKTLPVYGKREKTYINDMRQALYDYAQSTKDTPITYEELIDKFGESKDCAANYILSTDPETLRKKLKVSNYIKIFVFTAIILIFVVFSIIVVMLYKEWQISRSVDVASYTTYIIEEDTEVIDDSIEIIDESTEVIDDSTEIIDDSTEVIDESTETTDQTNQ